MKKIRFIIFVLFGILELTGFGQNSLSLSLEEAKELAITNNLDLRQNALDVEIQKATVKENIAEGLPQINGSFGYNYNILNSFDGRTSGSTMIEPGPVDQLDGFSQLQSESIDDYVNGALGSLFSGLGSAFSGKHSANASVTISQQLFDGVYTLGIKAADVFVSLTEKQAIVTERDIRKEVEKAYYAALISQENLNILDNNIKNVNQVLSETKATYQAGFVEQLDVDRLELSLANIETQRVSIARLQDLSYAVLKNLLTIPLSTDIVLTEDIDEIERILYEESLDLMALETGDRVEFEILDIQEKLQEINVQRYKKGYLPTVDLVASGGYDYLSNSLPFTQGFDGWYPGVSAGLQVGIPIFDGNRKKAQIAKAQLEVDKVRLSRDALVQGIDIETKSAAITFQNALNNVNSQRDNLELAQKIYDVTQIKYKEGVGSSLERSAAEQDLYTTQQNYINALYDLLIAKVDLEKALGK